MSGKHPEAARHDAAPADNAPPVVRAAPADSTAHAAALPFADAFEQSEPGRKGQILAAALSVFAERGYSSGSMREIADRVGVSEPAIYRHFSGKDALFLALIGVAGRRVSDEGCRLVAELRPDTLREQIVLAFADRRRAMRVYAPLLRTVVATVSRNPEFLAEYRSVVVDPLQRRLTEKAAELDVTLGPPGADASRDARVRALLALVMGYLLSAFVIGDEPDEAVADAVLNVMEWQPPRQGGTGEAGLEA